jgi:tetratricopeptide (TPR) repeat protein
MFDSTRHRLPRITALVVFLLLVSGDFQPSRGQFLGPKDRLKKQINRVVRQPNPKGNTNSNLSRRAGNPRSLVENLIELGNKARDNDEPQKALDYYQRALTHNAKEARAYYGLGSVYLDQRCSDKALEAYGKAIANDPKYAEAYRGMAAVYWDEKLYEQAITQYKKTLSLNPADYRAQIWLGRVYLDQKNYTEAIAQFSRFLNHPTPEGKAFAHAYLGYTSFLQNNYQTAIEHSRKALSLMPHQSVSRRTSKQWRYASEAEVLGTDVLFYSYWTLAYSYFYQAQGNVGQQAVAEYVKLLDDLFAGSLPLVEKPDIPIAKPELLKATDAMRSLILLFPDTPNAHIMLGNAYASQNSFKEAVQEIEQAIRLREAQRAKSKPDVLQCAAGKREDQEASAGDFIELGNVFFAQAKFEKEQKGDNRADEFFKKAIEQYNKALSLDSESYSAYWALGDLYKEQEKYEDSINQYKKALLYLLPESSEEEVGLNFNLAWAYTLNEDFGDAIRPLQKTLQSFEQQPTAIPSSLTALIRLWLAYCFYETEQYPQAITQINEALKTIPNFAVGHYLLGQIYYKQERYQDAITQIQEGRRLDTNKNFSDEEDEYALGESYRLTGRYQEAISEFEKILSHFVPLTGRPEEDVSKSDEVLKHAKARYSLGLIYIQLKNKEAALKQYQELKGLWAVQLEGSDKMLAQDLLDKINAMP